MLKHFLPFTLLYLFFDFGVYAQSQHPILLQIPISENNSVLPQELNYYLDSVSAYLPSPAIGKFIERPKNLIDSHLRKLKNHQVSSWEIKSQNLGNRVFFDHLKLNKGDSLLSYTLNGQLLEITTSNNHFGQSFTSIYSENGLILELKNYSNAAEAHISGYSLEPKKNNQSSPLDFGESENCQINVNCSEGENFRDIQKSVVRILIKLGSSFLWCTGSVVNNTDYNYEPYILSAEHCGLLGNDIAPQSDLNSWTFYFNYESPSCDNPISEGNLNQQRITGASVLANSNDGGGDFGSDFMLLKLASAIPSSFNAYYSGWNHQVKSIPTKGVGIHHPTGDIKKISTYQFKAESGSFGGSVDNTHWIVSWTKTVNGFGTTEKGSSGSPLFDENNLIRGVLTGGGSACNNLNADDYYGKLSYGWNSNGQAGNRRLDVWLDPSNRQFLAINGAYEGDEKPVLNEDTISVFPSPATGDFVKIRNIGRPQEILTISVSFMDGKLIYASETVVLPGEDFILDIKGWAAGMYFVQITQNGNRKKAKFVIIESS